MKWTWTAFRVEQATAIREIVNELEPYQPLTLRQVHYQAVSKGLRVNTRSRYNDLSKLVKQMRLDGYLSWDAIEDRSRVVGKKRGYEDSSEWMNIVLNAVGRYERCLIQGQETYVEVWVEKDALRHVFEQVSLPLCIRLVTTRGFSSVTLIKGYAERARAAIEAGQQPVLLFFSDFDPSGMEMIESVQKTVTGELHVRGVEFERPALTMEQIEEYGLPYNPDALKKHDTRAKRFLREHGQYSVELDALHPQVLQAIIRDAIEDYVDMGFVQEQRQIEKEERAKLERVQNDIRKVLQTHGLRV